MTETTTVTPVRADLYRAHLAWEERRQAFRPDDEDGAKRIAYSGALMASTYAYTLAAVLKVAADELGLDAASILAAEASRILADGDADDVNADLVSAAEVSS